MSELIVTPEQFKAGWVSFRYIPDYGADPLKVTAIGHHEYVLIRKLPDGNYLVEG